MARSKMKYREEIKVTEKHKKEYVDGFERVIKERQKECETKRTEYFKDVFKNQDKYRNDLKEMLGWPLVGVDLNKIPVVTAEKLSHEDGYEIYRMQFEILDGLKLTGLFFKAQSEKPLVIVQHGGLGTPEIISGVYGNTGNYNDMLQRVIKHGIHAFAPQLLLWNAEEYNVPKDRGVLDARLKRVGSSITAVELYGIILTLNYFEKQDFVSDFGMVGLSYGGFYTLYASAIDTRIKSAISCSFFNKRDMYAWADWTWFKSAEKFDDAEIASLVYPRDLCIQIGSRDELFDYKYGEESFEKLKEICKEVGTDWVSFMVFDGVHEFCIDDEPIKKLISRLM